ncbi:MAG: hypothetical protein IJB71_03920 [Bacilli bacterium]|nr:hypothetical protein [Bacilli bacterium]
MNNMFTTIFENERTPKWVKILIKFILLAFILIIGIIFTYSSINRKDYFGLILAILYDLVILTIIFFLIKNKIKVKK